MRKTKKPKLGTGERFRKLVSKLKKRKEVRTPEALAASIGRRKYGKRRFAQLAIQGRRRASKKRQKL